MTWAEALACHDGAGYTNWIDEVQYDGNVFSRASDNSNSKKK